MNLRAIANGLTSAVNPNIAATLLLSNGYTTAGDGTQTPAYNGPYSVIIQRQDVTVDDLKHLDALNVQGSTATMFMSGNLDAIVRVSSKGGDLVTMPDGTVWLVTTVLERWPDWVRAAVKLQNQ